MPKKKLTKKQVLAKMKRARAALEDMGIDKYYYRSDSFVPMTFDKINSFLGYLVTQHVKILRRK